jgi:hypothetical protein
MKNLLLSLSLVCLAPCLMAQIVLPNSPAPLRDVVNTEMLIQFNGQKLEVLPTQRGIRNSSGAYKLMSSDASEPFTRDSLGVAYSYALRGPIFLTGEVSVKLKPGFQATALSGTGTNARLMVPPDVYIMMVSTPSAMVNLVKQLQLNPAVEWVEPFTTQGNIH